MREGRIPQKTGYAEAESIKIRNNSDEERSFRRSLSRIVDKGHTADKSILVGVTPNAIDCCVNKKGLNLVINKRTITKCIRKELRDKKGKQTRKSGHGLTEDQINEAIWAIKRPIMIIRGSKENSIAVMTSAKDNEGRYIFVFINPDKPGATERVNVISSIYGRNNLEAYLQKCFSEEMVLAMDKEKVDDVLPSIGGHFSKASAPINFDSTIAYSYNSVKNV